MISDRNVNSIFQFRQFRQFRLLFRIASSIESLKIERNFFSSKSVQVWMEKSLCFVHSNISFSSFFLKKKSLESRTVLQLKSYLNSIFLWKIVNCLDLTVGLHFFMLGLFTWLVEWWQTFNCLPRKQKWTGCLICLQKNSNEMFIVISGLWLTN